MNGISLEIRQIIQNSLCIPAPSVATSPSLVSRCSSLAAIVEAVVKKTRLLTQKKEVEQETLALVQKEATQRAFAEYRKVGLLDTKLSRDFLIDLFTFALTEDFPSWENILGSYLEMLLLNQEDHRLAEFGKLPSPLLHRICQALDQKNGGSSHEGALSRALTSLNETDFALLTEKFVDEAYASLQGTACLEPLQFVSGNILKRWMQTEGASLFNLPPLTLLKFFYLQPDMGDYLPEIAKWIDPSLDLSTLLRSLHDALEASAPFSRRVESYFTLKNLFPQEEGLVRAFFDEQILLACILNERFVFMSDCTFIPIALPNTYKVTPYNNGLIAYRNHAITLFAQEEYNYAIDFEIPLTHSREEIKKIEFLFNRLVKIYYEESVETYDLKTKQGAALLVSREEMQALLAPKLPADGSSKIVYQLNEHEISLRIGRPYAPAQTITFPLPFTNYFEKLVIKKFFESENALLIKGSNGRGGMRLFLFADLAQGTYLAVQLPKGVHAYFDEGRKSLWAITEEGKIIEWTREKKEIDHGSVQIDRENGGSVYPKILFIDNDGFIYYTDPSLHF